MSDLEFHEYSLENLREEEKLNMYPPRFKIFVNRLSHDKNLDTEFKIVLENDGVLVSDKDIYFPLLITNLVAEASSGRIVSL